MPEAELLPRYFSNQGYWSAGSGKMLHYVIDPQSWDDYFPDKAKDDPFPRTFYPKKRPVTLPRGGPWQYVETDWAALDVTDEEFGGDWAVTKWIGEQLQLPRDKPFFLACGIYRPHEPWFVPKQYFEPFPLESIQLPPGYKVDDVDDLPAAGQRLARNRYFAHIQKHEQWKQGIQAYLASIHFADAMLGRVLDALEKSPHRDNTIVVLWSDHGWHLGEKEHWQKYTGWRVCARVPLMIRVPKGAPGLPEGTTPGSVCDRPVSLVDLFGTLTDLCGLPSKVDIINQSLVPLLRDPESDWPHAAITHLDKPENYAISTQRWRYIHYAGDEEELYDIETDPHEWNNLAAQPEHANKLAEMRRLAPAQTPPVASPSKKAATTRFDPVIRQIEGWSVHIDPALLGGEHQQEGTQALTMLSNHLQRIGILIPPGPLEKMRKLEIWIEHHHPTLKNMQYHPSVAWLIENGHDPRLEKKVHIPRAADLFSREHMLKHPAVILHELAHAYHDQVLGFTHPEILATYEQAVQAGKYQRVMDHRGRQVRHYALSNAKEYFAEGTESFFYRNDFHPFVRAELKLHDPALHQLLIKIWEEP